ncbi:MAG: hypothetical protein U5N86_10825 [Planctomycetota bacterium]|nr:hypothetical protein [Planctomycetota bacterium]
MRRILAIVVLLCVFPVFADAHLCNDVFVQAKDNLAVKVDVRDGQLRIADEASFKVYLLNTMDRDIVNINMSIKSDQFDAKVEPSPDWDTFPKLKAVRTGGKKEHFEITLTKKTGVREGRYQVGLHLYNGRNKAQVFKTVDMNASADIAELKKASRITVNWHRVVQRVAQQIPDHGLYEYVRKGRYF